MEAVWLVPPFSRAYPLSEDRGEKHTALKSFSPLNSPHPRPHPEAPQGPGGEWQGARSEPSCRELFWGKPQQHGVLHPCLTASTHPLWPFTAHHLFLTGFPSTSSSTTGDDRCGSYSLGTPMCQALCWAGSKVTQLLSV